jgi:hypothetical protein
METNVKVLFLAAGLLAICAGYVHACRCYPDEINGCLSDYCKYKIISFLYFKNKIHISIFMHQCFSRILTPGQMMSIENYVKGKCHWIFYWDIVIYPIDHR